MGVELEYFYLLHKKTISFYNFTQSSRINSWWFETIKKQTKKNEFQKKCFHSKLSNDFLTFLAWMFYSFN
jgi:hypothetical protein